jgi:hypothetical protein
MLAQLLTSATRHLRRSWADCARQVHALRARYREIEDVRQVRGLTLLREWLSPEQRAQFDASKCFDVVGCDSGRRYRIRHGTGTNVYEIDDAGRPLVGWCFVPLGQLVAGDVMLTQKIALETNERAALAVANRFPVDPPGRANAAAIPRRAY